ncbi:SemiSWEET transporter [Ideonella sp. DXS29W]|uniref:SemiSWEET transporter n=1 Tax=Ideonella lacteola TaxID=2984193 RepID=A0ABU9BR14_9BURK
MTTDQLLHWLGYPAACLTTFAFIPQAWLTLRTRNVSGISALTYAAFTLGVVLWLAYGWHERDWALIAANTITLPLAASILWTKLREDARARRSHRERRPH